MNTVLPWAVRILVVAGVAAGFNYWLHTQADDAFATDLVPNNYARVQESNYGSYLGIEGNIWTGSPDPVPGGSDPSFSNQTIWAINPSNCGGLSWVEAGWTRKGATGLTYYKFIYKVPSTNSCTYTEELSGNPAAGSFHLHRLEYCSSGCAGTKWRWWRDGLMWRALETGWQNASYLQAGGEVGGAGVGMHGGINALKYRRGTTWYVFNFADSYRCDYGYNLLWSTPPHSIFDWGYQPPGSCPG